MPPTEIHIDSVHVDLRGVNPALAQDALAALGPAIDAALHTELYGRAARSVDVGNVAMPVLSISPNTDAATLRGAVAAHVARAIASQMGAPRPIIPQPTGSKATASV